MNLSNLNVGDAVVLASSGKEQKTKVIRKGKKFLSVAHQKATSNYQIFRIKDGMDFGPETKNVYFLKI